MDNNELKKCLKASHIITQSYTHYGGESGLQDYGPVGFEIKRKLLDVWIKRFVKSSNNIRQVEIPTLVPAQILGRSGHTVKFYDYVMYHDDKCYRVDHLIKDHYNSSTISAPLLKNVETMTESEMEAYVWDNNILPRDCIIQKKHLMFETSGKYLRPELAQGIFVNFNSYFDFFRQKLPFGIAQVGKSYRDEISPKPFVRLREFSQAELEYFVDPSCKTHPLYNYIKDVELPLLNADMQIRNINMMSIRIGDAIDHKIISHELMAYFLNQIYQFALEIGLDKSKIRFRQHLPEEKAHYAIECWDLEANVDGHWLECVGCADRGDYDLTCHNIKDSSICKRNLEKDEYTESVVYKININKKCISKKYGPLTQSIASYFDSLSQEEIKDLEAPLTIRLDDQTLVICDEMFSITAENIIVKHMKFIPHVLEPSFGIDRLMYAVLEHSFIIRDNTKYVLKLNNNLTPYDCALFNLTDNDETISIYDALLNKLKNEKLDVFTEDSSVNIGKKYIRADQIGVKYCITIDPASFASRAVTIRDRDTKEQISVSLDNMERLLEFIKLMLKQ